MKYRKLGRTGFEVSEMAHGLWGMSGWTGSDDKESLAALQLATDMGCNFFDTAWAYGDGKSDGLLGEILTRNSGSVCTLRQKSRHLTESGRPCPPTSIRTFFPRPCFQTRRPDPEEAPGGRDRCAAVSSW